MNDTAGATKRAPANDWAYSLSMPADLRSVRVLRATLATVLGVAHLSDLTDTALLLASEVITNALTHAGGPPTAFLSFQDRVLRVAIADRSPVLPQQRAAADDEEGGRGLFLLQLCADRWGSAPLAGGGKSVWFELEETAA